MSTGSQVSRLPTKKVRLPDLVPPTGAKPVGVHEPTGKVIYEMEVLDVETMQAKKKQKIDYEGNPVFKKHPTTGEAQYPIFQLPEPIFRTKRFILQAGPSQKVAMVENFAETPDEIAERTERQKVESFTADLASEAVRRGFTNASEMMDSLFGEKSEEAEVVETE
tara:strand:- start:3042 stop:3536 length:495 start_codon:yes stop_codon:yes gene_type:complete